MQGGSQIDTECFSWINEELDVYRGYLCMHHNTMHANYNQYIQCRSTPVGMLKTT